MPVAPTDPSPSLAVALLGLLGLALIMGTLAAWTGVFWRFLTRRPLWGPTAGPRVVSWHGGTILGVVILYVILATVVGSAARAFQKQPPALPDTIQKSDKPAPPPELSPQRKLAFQAVINGAILAAVPWFLRRTTGTTLADFGLSRRGFWANLNRGAGAFFLVGLPVYGLMRLALVIWPRQQHPVEEMLRLHLDAGTIALALISAVVLAPMVEELLFRGLLLGWLQRLFDPASVVVANRPEEPEPLDDILALEPMPPPRWFRILPDFITAGLFAAMHLSQWPAPLPLFVLALALGALMRRTGSLWAPIGLHAFFNGVSTLGMLLGSAAGVELEPEPQALVMPAPGFSSCVDIVGVSGDWANSGVAPGSCQGIAEKKVENVLGDRPRLNYDSAVTLESPCE